MKLTHKAPRGFTLIELLVVIAIIAILASLAIPAISKSMDKAKLLQGVSNGKQIATLANAMALDQSSTGDPKLGWPGDLVNSTDPAAQITDVASYVKRLTDYDYIKTQDVGKVFGGPGLPVWDGISPFTYTGPCGWKIFKVTGSDGGNIVFLASKNYTYNTSLDTKPPYGETGFVVVRKDTSATSYQKQQVTNVMQIGYMTNTPTPSATAPGTEAGNFLQ